MYQLRAREIYNDALMASACFMALGALSGDEVGMSRGTRQERAGSRRQNGRGAGRATRAFSYRDLTVATVPVRTRPPPPHPPPPPPPHPQPPPPRQSRPGFVQLLAAYFTSGPTTEYSGSFKVEPRSLQQSVDDLFRESALPGLGGARLAIVHDNSKLGVRSTYRGVDLHLVPKPEMPLHQARWRAYLQAFGADAFPPEQCVFAIDLGDVRLIKDPGELCEQHPEKLFVGADICSHTRTHDTMQYFVNKSGFSASGAFANWLKRTRGWKSKWRAKNCGIVGGLQRRVWPFISAQAELTDAHWQAVQRRADVRALLRIRGPVDMLVLNQLLLDRNESHVSGFPSGPVNMPFMGNLCHHHHCSYSSKRYDECIREQYQALLRRNYYYFTHKLAWNRSKSVPFIHDVPSARSW